jgi:hypothetical protein
VNPLSGVFGEAWRLYKAHWLHFFTIAVIVYALLWVLSVLLTAALGTLGAIMAAFIALAGAFWLQGVLIEAVRDVRDGRADLSVRETFARALPRFNRIALAGILAAIGITFGLLLLILPGLILLTIWIMIIPAIVLEDRDVFEAFGRSRELVRGHGLNVFGVIVLTVLLLIGVSLLISVLLAPLENWVARLVGDIAGNTIVAPFVVTTWTLAYHRLRAAKEPAEPEPASELAV